MNFVAEKCGFKYKVDYGNELETVVGYTKLFRVGSHSTARTRRDQTQFIANLDTLPITEVFFSLSTSKYLHPVHPREYRIKKKASYRNLKRWSGKLSRRMKKSGLECYNKSNGNRSEEDESNNKVAAGSKSVSGTTGLRRSNKKFRPPERLGSIPYF